MFLHFCTLFETSYAGSNQVACGRIVYRGCWCYRSFSYPALIVGVVAEAKGASLICDEVKLIDFC